MSKIDDAIRDTLASILDFETGFAFTGTSANAAPETAFTMADLCAAMAKIEAIDAEFEAPPDRRQAWRNSVRAAGRSADGQTAEVDSGD